MFNYFISLGPTCATASSMSKYGLRSFSGLFDWLITFDFSWVLRCIETDFKDFLQQENLEPLTASDFGWLYHFYKTESKAFLRQRELELIDTPRKFKEKHSGFMFIHEEHNYITEFNVVKQKYEKRIKNFIMACHKKTCFLRRVPEERELEYIVGHADYIKKVIGKYNKENDIIFLVNKEIPIPLNLPFKVYRTPIDLIDPSFLGLRSHFDGATEFLGYCWSNYPRYALISNLQFDYEKESKRERALKNEKSLKREKDNIMRYRTMTAIANHDFSKDRFPPEIMIYGAGNLGRTLYKRIFNYTHVECFIDRSKFGTEIQGVPVRPLDALKDIKEACIIVSTTYDFEAIKASLQERCAGALVVSLDDFMGVK